MSGLPIHAHDFRAGDIVWQACSTASLRIVAFANSKNGPLEARCYYVSDPRRTTMGFDVADLRKSISHQPHETRQ